MEKSQREGHRLEARRFRRVEPYPVRRSPLGESQSQGTGPNGANAGGSDQEVEYKKRILLAEMKRVDGLPKGKYSLHRLRVIKKALELLKAGFSVSDGSELDGLLEQLCLGNTADCTKPRASGPK